jgi:hypothetical protein
MLLIASLILVVLFALSGNTRFVFNMYKTNDQLDENCLLHIVDAKLLMFYSDRFTVDHAHQTISFCLQSVNELSFDEEIDTNESISSRLTFSELKQRNITSDMLLAWSATVDLAEDYQIFLNNDSLVSSTGERTFYNCTSLWFGPLCRFTFVYKMNESFDSIVYFMHNRKTKMNSASKTSCYVHLNCRMHNIECLD